MLDPDGIYNIAGSPDFSPFGEPTSSPTQHTYLGYRNELQTGDLVHLRARDYDPTTGTFLAPDPLDGVDGTPTVANPYHYADNDPLRMVDPSGERARDEAVSGAESYYYRGLCVAEYGRLYREEDRSEVEARVSSCQENREPTSWEPAYHQSVGLGASFRGHASYFGDVFHATRGAQNAHTVSNPVNINTHIGAGNRFGEGFYVSESPVTAIAEVLFNGTTPDHLVGFQANLSSVRKMDLRMSPGAYDPHSGRSETAPIRATADRNDVDVIVYPSNVDPSTTNYAILRKAEVILSGRPPASIADVYMLQVTNISTPPIEAFVPLMPGYR